MSNFLRRPGTDKSKVGRLLRKHVWLPRRWSEMGICDMPSHDCNWFVQGGASPCIYLNLEKQLRVWVHGDDFVPLGYIVSVRWFFMKLQEFWVVTN